MKLVRWSINNLHFPMAELEDGTLCCTTGVIARGLGVTVQQLYYLHAHYTDEFDTLSVKELELREFFRANKTEFGLQRIRSDMHVWTEDDVLLLAALSHTPHGKDFRKQFVVFLKSNRTRGYVTQEQYDALLLQVNTLRDIVLRAQPALDKSAPAASPALNAQKQVRRLRLVK